MTSNKTKAKLKYNRATYKRYEFNIRTDTKLYALVEKYKAVHDNEFSALLKELLCSYFSISEHEASDIFTEYYFGPGDTKIRNTSLDCYFAKIETDDYGC